VVFRRHAALAAEVSVDDAITFEAHASGEIGATFLAVWLIVVVAVLIGLMFFWVL
jgi:hypothetical protein